MPNSHLQVRSNGSDVQGLIAILIAETSARMYSPWRKWTSAGAAGNEAQRALWEFGRRCVQDYVDAGGNTQPGAGSTPVPLSRGHRHLIGHMPWVQRCVQSGTALTPEELDATVADLITFLVAGHETTGHTLAWTLWLTSTHPEVERRCNDFDPLCTLFSSLASTDAVSAMPCRVVYIMLPDVSC